MAKKSKKTVKSGVIKPKGSGKSLTDAARASIIKFRKQDPKRWTYCTLAEKFGCTDGTVFQVVNAKKSAKPKAKAKKTVKPKAKAKKAVKPKVKKKSKVDFAAIKAGKEKIAAPKPAPTPAPAPKPATDVAPDGS